MSTNIQEEAGPAEISQIVRFYADQGLTQPLDFDSNGSLTLLWKEVRAGASNPLVLFIKNIHRFKIQLQPHIPTDPDVQLTRYPTELQPNESGLIELDFQCPITRNTPPSSLFGFDYLIVRYI